MEKTQYEHKTSIAFYSYIDIDKTDTQANIHNSLHMFYSTHTSIH